jgi:hypothetical protein
VTRSAGGGGVSFLLCCSLTELRSSLLSTSLYSVRPPELPQNSSLTQYLPSVTQPVPPLSYPASTSPQLPTQYLPSVTHPVPPLSYPPSTSPQNFVSHFFLCLFILFWSQRRSTARVPRCDVAVSFVFLWSSNILHKICVQ